MPDPAPARPPFPWEVRVAVWYFILSALWTIYHLVSTLVLSEGERLVDMRLLGVWEQGSHIVLKVLCIMGLARRSAWGWWTSVFYLGILCLGSVHTIRFFVGYSQGQFSQGEFRLTPLVFGVLLGILAGAVLALLIRSRRRGAYGSV